MRSAVLHTLPAPLPGCLPRTASTTQRILRRLYLTLLAVLLCLPGFLLQGCSTSGSGGGNSGPTPTPTATITSPTAQLSTGVLPVTVTVQLGNGATPSNTSITVDGVDVTSSFTTSASGLMTGQLSSTQVYVGSNRLVASVTSRTGAFTPSSSVTFTYDPTLAPHAVAATYEAPPADVTPILTHVRYGSQGAWGVQIGNTAYPAQSGVDFGFQVLKFNRSNLALVSNTTFSVYDSGSLETFLAAAAPQAANITNCGYEGCLEVVQSLGSPGWNPCVQNGGPSCADYQNTLKAIGGTDTVTFTPNNSADIGYSFIGNVGQDTLHAGSQNERVDCQSYNCGTFPKPNDTLVDQGVVPNGAGDDVVPTINNTVPQSCPTTTATPAMPAVVYCLAGSIKGVLLRSGDQTYVFSYTDPSIRFSIAKDPNDPYRSIFNIYGSGNVKSFSSESEHLPYVPNHIGGIHLVILDATDLSPQFDRTYTVWLPGCGGSAQPSQNPPASCVNEFNATNYNLAQFDKDIRFFSSRRFLFFIHALGNLDHDYVYGFNTQTSNQNNYYAQDIWNRMAQSIQDLGGSYVTFDSLNNPSFKRDRYDAYVPHGQVPQDDYIMVGQWWIFPSGVDNPYAAEESTQITRQTLKVPNTPASAMYGVLDRDRDGFYRVSSEGLDPDFSPQAVLDLNNASLTTPVSWPIGSQSTGGTLAAYTWLSHQLLHCPSSACSDIHNAYSNLNVSPNSWQALLAQINPPSDGGDGFSISDYQEVKGQLSTEFQYLAAVRAYQANLQTLLLAEQANLSVILQQVFDSVAGNIPVNVRQGSTTYGNWEAELKDGINIVSALSAAIPGVPNVPKLVIATADLAIDASTKKTVDPRGRTLEELSHVDVAAGQIAQQKAQQFAAILSTEGNQFVRISNDWQRLQAVGRPLANNSLPWSADALGPILNSFDIALTRSLYRRLMPSAYNVVHYRFSSPGVHDSSDDPGGTTWPALSDGCQLFPTMQAFLNQNFPQPFAYWPGAPIDGLAYPIQDAGNTGAYGAWWDLWMLQPQSANAPFCPNTTDAGPSDFYANSGLFDPLDPADPTRLGLYKPWFFQRSGVPVVQQNTPVEAWYFWENEQELSLGLTSSNSNLDPVSY